MFILSVGACPNNQKFQVGDDFRLLDGLDELKNSFFFCQSSAINNNEILGRKSQVSFRGRKCLLKFSQVNGIVDNNAFPSCRRANLFYSFCYIIRDTDNSIVSIVYFFCFKSIFTKEIIMKMQDTGYLTLFC